jgi:acyl carrier protein
VKKKIDVLNWVIDWFERNTTASRQELLDAISKSYFDLGWVDSLKFVSFIMDIEQNFNINFSNHEFQDRDFSTIQGLAMIINSHLENENDQI